LDGTRASFSVQIATGADSDQTEVDHLSADLRRALLELDVDAVARASDGPAPPNAKAGGTSLSDVLIVSLSNSTALVSVVQLLGLWIKRGAGRTVKIKIGKDSIEVGTASPETEAKLVESWIDWHDKH
jgi:hypothetical protein